MKDKDNQEFVRSLVLACAVCGEIITSDVRLSPEPLGNVIYVGPCLACYPTRAN